MHQCGCRWTNGFRWNLMLGYENLSIKYKLCWSRTILSVTLQDDRSTFYCCRRHRTHCYVYSYITTMVTQTCHTSMCTGTLLTFFHTCLGVLVLRIWSVFGRASIYSMNVLIYVYMYVCVYIYICTCVCVNVYICVCICMYVCVYECVCVCVWKCV